MVDFPCGGDTIDDTVTGILFDPSTIGPQRPVPSGAVTFTFPWTVTLDLDQGTGSEVDVYFYNAAGGQQAFFSMGTFNGTGGSGSYTLTDLGSGAGTYVNYAFRVLPGSTPNGTWHATISGATSFMCAGGETPTLVSRLATIVG